MRQECIVINVSPYKSVTELTNSIDDLNDNDWMSYDMEYNVNKNKVVVYFDETEEITNEQIAFIEQAYGINFSAIKEEQNKPYTIYKTQKDLIIFLKNVYE